MAVISINVPTPIQNYVLEAFCVERGYADWAAQQQPERPALAQATMADRVDFLCYYLARMVEGDTLTYERSKAATNAANARAALVEPLLSGQVVVTVTG